jgi:hypothetical protein
MGGVLRGTRKKHGKLIPAPACNDILRPATSLQYGGYLSQKLVPRIVPKSVIRQLQAVHITHYYAEWKLSCALQPGNLFFEICAIVQTGQSIVKTHEAQSFVE